MKGVPPDHTKFKKGQSGNPNGRPKKLPELKELMALVLGEEKDGISAAEAILKAQRAKAAKGDTRAAEWLFERGYGKAQTHIDITTDGEKMQQQVIVLPNGATIPIG
jgi:hypothetical protein